MIVKHLKHVLAGAALLGSLPAMAQEPPAAGTSPRTDAIREAGVLGWAG